eukprot:6184649-Amphidinium_carterae.1
MGLTRASACNTEKFRELPNIRREDAPHTLPHGKTQSESSSSSSVKIAIWWFCWVGFGLLKLIAALKVERFLSLGGLIH